jgi:hypothetical protein
MIFDIAGNVPADQVVLIKAGLDLAEDYVERLLGGAIPDNVMASSTTTIIATGLSNATATGGFSDGKAVLFFDVAHPHWNQDSNWRGWTTESDNMKIVAHEYTHAWQGWLGAFDKPLGGAFIEGIAEYIAYLVMVDAGRILSWSDVRRFMLYSAWDSDELAAPVQEVEDDIWSGHVGFLAIDWLVGDAPSGLLSLRILAEEIGNGKSVPDAFRTAFNISIVDFYVQFEDWRQILLADAADGYTSLADAADGYATRPTLINIGEGHDETIRLLSDISQIPTGVDPRSIVDSDRLEKNPPPEREDDPVRDASMIYIGGSMVLTAAHVPFQYDPVTGEFKADSIFRMDFAEALGGATERRLSLNGGTSSGTQVDGRERFVDLVPGKSDIALIDLSRGGSISRADASYLDKIAATPLIVFQNPSDAISAPVFAIGYPDSPNTTLGDVIPGDGQSAWMTEGQILSVGPGPGTALSQWETNMVGQGGFSGSGVFIDWNTNGSNRAERYLGGIWSGGGEYTTVEQIGDVYWILAAYLDDFADADDFARNALIGDMHTGRKLMGTFFHEDLHGGDGNDTLDGAGGKDRLFGGKGDDTYIVKAGDEAKESALSGSSGGGLDTVKAYVSWTLGSKIENLVLKGSHSLTGKGNSLANSLMGNDAVNSLDGLGGDDTVAGGKGADILTGGTGLDSLVGGVGKDAFVFKTKLGSSNADTIADFKHDEDVIQLDNSIFRAIGASLTEGELYSKAGAVKAHDADDRIVYDKSTGRVYSDDDGKGGHAAILFAVLINKPQNLDEGDFVIV